MTYKWLEGQEAVDELQDLVTSQGWTPLNPWTTRARVAYDEAGSLVGFIVLQMVGFVGPEWVRPGSRDGHVSHILAQEMYDFLDEVQARGYLAICDNLVAAKLCKQHGMVEVKSPVYITPVKREPEENVA